MTAGLILPSRRGFLLGLGAALCAPAVVRAASLMPIRAPKNTYLTLQEITREAARLFSQANTQTIQWGEIFAEDAKFVVGSTLRIKLPDKGWCESTFLKPSAGGFVPKPEWLDNL